MAKKDAKSNTIEGIFQEKTQNKTLEQNIRELEKIAHKIEGEISINEIVSTYKTASEIIQQCKAEIKNIENEIIEINAQSNFK